MSHPHVLYVHPIGIDAGLIDLMRNAGFVPDVALNESSALELMEILHFAVVIVHPDALASISFVARAQSVIPGVDIVVLSDSSCGELASLVVSEAGDTCPIVRAGRHDELIAVLDRLTSQPMLRTG